MKQVQPAPVVECVTPASAVTYAHASLVVEYVTPAPTVAYASPVTARTAATTVFPTATALISKLRQVSVVLTYTTPVEIPQLQILDMPVVLQ